VYLPDDLAGQTITCEADGLVRGLFIGASGRTTATLAPHQLVPAAVVLAPPSCPPGVKCP
jgi:hypothetical protein